MKRVLVACAAALLAVPQGAMAQDALCEQLDAYAAAQWNERSEPIPRYWVEFHRGIQADAGNSWSWGCRDAGDNASGEFCDWLMENSSRSFQTYLPFALLKCMGDQVPDQAAAERQFIQGKFRRQAQDGSWVVLEVTSNGLSPGESAVRISFDAEDRRFDPEELPAMQPFAATAE
jgi:hypothetical protein